jgi:hypothetical protein
MYVVNIFSNAAKNVIPLKLLHKIQKKNSCELNPGTYGMCI